MQELKAEKPPESPADSDPVTRLMDRIRAEGFVTDQPDDAWSEFGEIIFRRDEKISFATGETVFIFTRIPEINERILRQTSESVVNTYRAKSAGQKALSVLQAKTVYHCLVTTSDTPHNELLNTFISRSGGATFIPVVIVPEINQVLYPDIENNIGSVRPRIEYLQFLLGERRETVRMHRQTIQAFWIAIAVIVLILAAIALSVVKPSLGGGGPQSEPPVQSTQ